MYTRFIRLRLPYVIAAVFFVIYLITLNRWITGDSLNVISRVTGWDWSPQVSDPLIYLITLPVSWLPVSIQPITLNLLSALLGALTLGQLARSVTLLPHDRTREQRQRERGDHSLLNLNTAWLPPLFACLICGFQLSFWEKATALNSVMLPLFLFSCIIRCLLEFRIKHEHRWLYLMALLYGVAIPNDWAFLSYFPLTVCALIWMKGFSFFRIGFLLRLAGLGAVGLTLYLLLPLIVLFKDYDTGGGFWALLKLQWGIQKNALLAIPKTTVLLLSLVTILPVFIMGIRFPSGIGDVSTIGQLFTDFMFRAMHLIFLTVCVLVAFDMPFSPRSVAQMLSLPTDFVTFYYLSCLAIGYYSGYALLVFRDLPHRFRKAKTNTRVLNIAVVSLLWLGATIAPVYLLVRNLPLIQTSNSNRFSQFGELLTENLPRENAILLADDVFTIQLVHSQLARENDPPDHVLVNTRALDNPLYEKNVRQAIQQSFAEVFPEGLDPKPLDLLTLFPILIAVAERDHPVYYLRDSYGLYFESFYPEQQGLVAELKLYGPEAVAPPPPSDEARAQNRTFWDGVQQRLPEMSLIPDPRDRGGRSLRTWCSRELNAWGVTLQIAGHLDEAQSAFERCLTWNPDNLSAQVNLRQNQALRQTENRETVEFSTQEQLTVQKLYRNNFDQLRMFDGPVDALAFHLTIGEGHSKGLVPNHRQSALHYRRARELDPASVPTQLKLIYSLFRKPFPQACLREIEAIHAADTQLPPEQAVSLVAVEAWSHLYLGEKAQAAGHPELRDASRQRAVHILEAALNDDPENESLLENLGKLFLSIDQNEQAMAIFDRHLKLAPDNSNLLQNLAVANIEIQNYPGAIAYSDRLLAIEPNHAGARINRAIAHYKNGDREQAKRDYEAAEKIAPDYHLIHYGLGKIAHADGDLTTAKSRYEAYLERAPQGTGEYEEISDALKSLDAP